MMRLALAQIDPVVGDLDGNRALIVGCIEQAKAAGTDIAVFPELATTGYPPEDLLLRPGFLHAARDSLEQIALAARGIVVMVGAPHLERDLFNACAVCAGGEIKAMVKKRFLPNYGVFDEIRYFASGSELLLFEHGERLVGVTICEDMWQPGPPATDLALAGAELIINISASPFHLMRDREREEMFKTRARDNSVYIAFCNTVGGQDELIVDIDPGAVVARRLSDARRRALAQDRGPVGPLPTIHIGTPHEHAEETVKPVIAPFSDDLEQMRVALELGLRDYVRKNGFNEV